MISVTLTKFCSFPETSCGKASLHISELAIAVALAVVGVLAILSKISLPSLCAYCLTGIGCTWLLASGIGYAVMMCKQVEPKVIAKEETVSFEQPEIVTVKLQIEPEVIAQEEPTPKVIIKLEDKPQVEPKVIVQEEPVPQQPVIAPKLEVMPTIDWQLQIKAHLSKAKEHIQAWKPAIDTQYLFRITLAEKEREMQAKLMADFEYIENDTEMPDQEKAELLSRMLKALPYRLGTQTAEISSFPLVGIPNYHANNCYLNVGLQALAHSHYGDYYLWCPTKKPEKPPELPPLPSEPNPVEKPNFDRENDTDKLILLSRQYDADKERYAEEKQKYEAALREYEGRQHQHDRYPLEMAEYDSKMQKQTYIRTMVMQLRAGKAPSKVEIETFQKHLDFVPGQPGDHNWLHQFGFESKNLTGDEYRTGYLSDKPWSILILGAGSHYKAIVRQKDGFHMINDGRVSKLGNTIDVVHKQVEAGATPSHPRPWQPYFLLPKSDRF